MGGLPAARLVLEMVAAAFERVMEGTDQLPLRVRGGGSDRPTSARVTEAERRADQEKRERERKAASDKAKADKAREKADENRRNFLAMVEGTVKYVNSLAFSHLSVSHAEPRHGAFRHLHG